jgi:hypothetical protein
MRARQIPTAAWAALVAVVALAGSVAGVVFTLLPDLKPDPREQISAAVSVFAVEPNVTISSWAHRAYPDSWSAEFQRIFQTKHPRADLLTNRGDVVYVRTNVDGYKHRSVSLKWSVYDADGCRRRSGTCRLDYDRVAAAPHIPDLQIDAPSRSSVQLLFIPSIQDLQDPARTFIRIELDDAHGTLAVTDTPILRYGVAERGHG